jgi:hemerythrin-like domain-containing protein
MEEQIKPIRRSSELVPLSRDHHDGLLLCWKIRQGFESKIDTERIAAYVSYCFENELAPHFRQEEEFVFSLLTDDDPMKAEVLAQHSILRNLSVEIGKRGLDMDRLLKSFEKELNNHIRYEEREVFPYIEKTANTELFAEAGRKIEQLHQVDKSNRWADDFWVRKK